MQYTSPEGASRAGQSPYSCRKVREEVGPGQDCVRGKKELRKWSNGTISLVCTHVQYNQFLSLEEELTPLSWCFYK